MCEFCGTDVVHAADDRFRLRLNRRQTLDMLAAGGLAALGTMLGGFGSAARAADDDVVRIGYLPITDATALLVAHGMGYFKDEGLTAERPTLDSRLVAAGRGLRRRQVQPGASAQADSGVDALQQQLPGQDHGVGAHQRLGRGRRRRTPASSRSPISAASRSRCRSGIRCTTSCCNTRCANPASSR